MRALRINRTKVTSRNAFIHNLFALKNEIESKMTKGRSLETARGFLICLLTFILQFQIIGKVLIKKGGGGPTDNLNINKRGGGGGSK